MLICISTGDFIQILIVALMIGGLYLALRSNNQQLSTFNEQLKLNFFSDYTKRYQEIILHFPEDINEKDFDYKLSLKEKDKTMRYMRAYFDLCSEEFYLNKKFKIELRFGHFGKGA